MAQNAIFILQDENLPTFKNNAYLRALDFDVEKIRPMYEAHYERIMEEAKAIIH
jgi:3-methyladenine DNA glycosylase Tag